jgi:hypothetical protein
MRNILVVGLALWTTACGAVDQLHSNHPILAAAADAPALREGVWLFTDDDGCPVDVRSATRSWPDCAHWAVVRGGAISERFGQGDHPDPEWSPFVVAAGEPAILQLGADDAFSYELLQTIDQDENGMIVEARRWPVLCSDYNFGKKPDRINTTDGLDVEPPPASQAPDGPPAPYLPGAYRIDEHCYTDTLKTLSVAQLRATGAERFPANFRWVRDRNG